MIARHVKQLTILFFMLSVIGNASVVELATDKPVWVINDETSLEAILLNHKLISEDKTQWLIPDTQIVLMGNVFSESEELNAQSQRLLTYQGLAEASNAALFLIQGGNEYRLISNSDVAFNLPIIIKWRNHLITHRGISLEAQQDNFDSSDDDWSADIHLPMFYQGTQICHPYFETSRLRESLSDLDVSTVWVGRTDASPDVPWQKRLMDQVNMIGQGVVVMLSESTEPLVTKDSEFVQAVQAPARYPANPVGLTDEEIIEILSNGEVIAEQEIPVGITKPVRLTLTHNGKTIDAIFKTTDSTPYLQKGAWRDYIELTDRYAYELVSYQLDRMLGLGLVPAVVIRKINGIEGSLQVWYDGLISKKDYRDDNIPYAGHCDRHAQRDMMHVFDYLIHNEDRNQSNMLYNRSDWQIWFIDHSRAYDVVARRHRSQKEAKFSVTDEFMEVLETIEKRDLYVLNDWLHREQINALHKRLRKLKRGQF